MKTKHGGKRSNSGRNPLSESEKKVPIIIYPQGKFVEAVGGKKEAQRIALEAFLEKSQKY